MKKARKTAKVFSLVVLGLLVCAILAPCLAGCTNHKSHALVQPRFGVILDGSFVTLGSVLGDELQYVSDTDNNEYAYFALGPSEELQQFETSPDSNTVDQVEQEVLFGNVLRVTKDEDNEHGRKVEYIRVNYAKDDPIVTENGTALKTVPEIIAVLGDGSSDFGIYVWEQNGARLEVVAEEETVVSFLIMYT